MPPCERGEEEVGVAAVEDSRERAIHVRDGLALEAEQRRREKLRGDHGGDWHLALSLRETKRPMLLALR